MERGYVKEELESLRTSGEAKSGMANQKKTNTKGGLHGRRIEAPFPRGG